MGSLEGPVSLIQDSLISELASSLKSSKLLIPASEGCPEKIKRWADTAEKQAVRSILGYILQQLVEQTQDAIMLATSASDISITLLFCQRHSIDFATRGGGHATSGASSSDGGIVINLSEMRNVTVNPVDKIITAQGGCLWADVDAAAGAHGLAIVGGTVNHTGIGGLTLGGGYGWLCGQHGLAIDNLLSVQIVLANGNIIHSSETENADLFWALRGAGQSFGVVTEFTYRAHPQPNPVWAGSLIFTPDKLDPLIAFTNHLSSISHPEAAIIIGFATPPPLHTPLLLTVVFYNGPEAATLSYFEPLLSLDPVMKEVSMIPYSSLNSLLNPGNAHGGRTVTKGSVFAYPIRPAFIRSLFNEFSTFLQETPDASGSMLGFEIYATEKLCQVSNEAMAFANRGTYGNSFLAVTWTQKQNDATCRAWARMLSEHFKAELERGKREGDVRLEMEGVGEYVNSDGLNADGRIIFGGNYERLVELKGKFDPENVFCKAHLGASLVKG